MLFVSCISLIQRKEFNTLQMSVLGSMLANKLLLPGISILYSIYRGESMAHNVDTARTNIMLLAFATCGFLIPTVFDLQTNLPDVALSAMSRAASVMLIVAYAGHLFYQLFTHKDEHDPDHPNPVTLLDEQGTSNRLRLWISVPTFIGLTILIYFVTDEIVASIQRLGPADTQMSFAYIVFPILNCDLAAIEQAHRSMDLMLAVTLGKSVQTGLFVAPALVIVGWGMGFDDMNLSFDLSFIATLFISVILLMQLTTGRNFTW